MNRRTFLAGGLAVAGACLLPESAEALLAEAAKQRRVGADIPWTTCLAAEMKTTGSVLGPKYEPNCVEVESTRQRCVKLANGGEYVEFGVKAPANAMVIRYSLPDSEDGKGINGSLVLYCNGKRLREVPVTSRFAWRYGNYPFVDDPKAGKTRNFYDEVRLKGLNLAKGDVVRIQKPADAAAYCVIDLVDLENVAAPLKRPANSVSLADFGAHGTGVTDDTDALRRCLAEAAKQHKIAWVPSGEYKLTRDIVMPAGVTLQGAGMWHTTFVGDEALYSQPDRRLRFKLSADNSHLQDFALIGKLKYRNDDEQNDGVFGAHGTNCTVSRLWIEHTKVGMWFYVCDGIRIEGCRLRNLLADGINLCVDVRNSTIENCTARNTGDDCFAIWPSASDQGFKQEKAAPGNNAIRRCSGQTPFLANGGAIYGGANNRIEDCLFTDIATGCGILLSTSFPTADDARHIDNNFSGTTVVRNCDLVRCGGYDHGWAWRAAFQICMERRSIIGVRVTDVRIKDSISDGFSVVAPGKGTVLGDTALDDVEFSGHSIGVPGRHEMWIREDAVGGLSISGARMPQIQNASRNFHFQLNRKVGPSF